MRRLDVWCTEYEHPEFGTAIITWTWRPVRDYRGAYEPYPLAVQFDLLTPVDEQAKLLSGLVQLEDDERRRLAGRENRTVS